MAEEMTSAVAPPDIDIRLARRLDAMHRERNAERPIGNARIVPRAAVDVLPVSQPRGIGRRKRRLKLL
jgi:hypothetical protein